MKGRHKAITRENLCFHRGRNDEKVEEVLPTTKDMKLPSNLVVDL
jgi:hypothetical protein